jgi:hypothetical protein
VAKTTYSIKIQTLRKMHTLLATIYRLGAEGDAPAGQELQRLVTSAALLIAVAIRNFAGKENHFAVASAWILFNTYTIAACEQAGTAPTEKISESLSAARQAVFDVISALADEAISRRHLVEGVAWADTEFYHARVALINGLISAYWLWCFRDGLKPPNLAAVEGLLALDLGQGSLWGEGSLPQLLAHYWYISRRDPSFLAERILGRLLASIIQCQHADELAPLPSPYYSIVDVVRHQHLDILGTANDPFDSASFKGCSYFAEGLFHLLVRTNLKQHCKVLWADYTRVNSRWFEVAAPWQFCTIHSEQGLFCTKVVPPTGEWAVLQEQARACGTPKVPLALRSDPIFLLLFVMVVPQRATPDVVRFLGRTFSDIWFLPEPAVDGH